MARRHLSSILGRRGTYGGGDGLEAIITMDQFKSLAVGALAGGAGIAATAAIMQRIPADKVKRTGRSIIAVLSGFVIGRLLMELDKDAGVAFTGGVAGFGLANLVLGLIKTDAHPEGYPLTLGSGYSLRGRRGLAASEIRVSRPGTMSVGPLGQAQTARMAPGRPASSTYGPGMGAVVVEEQKQLSSFLY